MLRPLESSQEALQSVQLQEFCRGTPERLRVLAKGQVAGTRGGLVGRAVLHSSTWRARSNDGSAFGKDRASARS
jgi:hypothetical protein